MQLALRLDVGSSSLLTGTHTAVAGRSCQAWHCMHRAHVQATDFGISRFMKPGEVTEEYCGTAQYMVGACTHFFSVAGDCLCVQGSGNFDASGAYDLYLVCASDHVYSSLSRWFKLCAFLSCATHSFGLCCNRNTPQAPEVFNMESGFPADVWAVGVMMHFVLCGEFPFTVRGVD